MSDMLLYIHALQSAKVTVFYTVHMYTVMTCSGVAVGRPREKIALASSVAIACSPSR
jgi:hypothetical protein